MVTRGGRQSSASVESRPTPADELAEGGILTRLSGRIVDEDSLDKCFEEESLRADHPVQDHSKPESPIAGRRVQ
ncbi:MAG: hypothetical protein CL957_07905 [Euryarchaeota archaeon]|nr:hypothetical protein [Euryarchaeota archaeon]